MMENLFSVLWPSGALTQIVIVFEVGLFIYWVGKLLKEQRRLKQLDEVITLCTDTAELQQDEPSVGAPGNSDQSEADTATSGNPKSRWELFCEQKTLDDPALRNHIKTLYDVGRMDSKLDISALIKHTVDFLFKENGTIRNILSSFIIIGLLGTLFGLAEALAQSSSGMQSALANASHIQSAAASSLVHSSTGKQLLESLKGAFTPSICGVLFTIFGMLLFTNFVQKVCTPLKQRIEFLTMNRWVPQLAPTTTQKLFESLQLSEIQMHKSFEAAQRVADFAGNIESQVSTLETNVKKTNQSLGNLYQSASKMDSIVGKFTNSVGKLTSFQDEIHSLYEQIATESSAFRDSVAVSVADATDFRNHSLEAVKLQNENVQRFVEQIGAYVGQIETTLNTARSFYENVGEQERHQSEEISKQLTSLFNDNFKDISSNLTTGYNKLVNAFGDSVEQLRRAATIIQSTQEATVNQTRTIVSDTIFELKESFQKLETANKETILDYAKQLAEGTQLQKTQLEMLNVNLEKFVRVLESKGASSEHSFSVPASGSRLDDVSVSRLEAALEKMTAEIRESLKGAGYIKKKSVSGWLWPFNKKKSK